MEAPVPTCPGWTVADLLVHTARVYRHKTHVLATRATAPPASGAWQRDDPPPEGAADRYDEELAALVGALASSSPSAAVWTWWPADQTAGFWYRRMAHETAVHRVDAEAALGRVGSVATELAIDGVDEALDQFLVPRIAEGSLVGAPTTVHLHATDGSGEWLVRLGPGGVSVEKGHAKGDVAARGTASDLLLWLWGRLPVDRLEVFGDATAVARLRAAAASVT